MKDTQLKAEGKEGEGYIDPTDGRVIVVVPSWLPKCFQNWARNRSSFSDGVSELALAHEKSHATRAAYARDE